MNGSERARPKSAPPSGGPTSLTAASRPVWAAAASGSWRTGTTARRAPARAAVKSAEPPPSTKATSAIAQKTAPPARIATMRAAIAATRTPSAAIISHLRFQRSAASPAGSASSAMGRPRAKATRPAFAAEPVTASTSSGYAIDVDCVPVLESSCPAWSSRKSRLRRSGSAVNSRNRRPASDPPNAVRAVSIFRD